MSIEAFERLSEKKQAAILGAGVKEFSHKTYTEASTDAITIQSNISKGLLFHYFGSKRAFYLYCLDMALKRLTAGTTPPAGESFYALLFSALDEKFRLCREYADETRLVNMASRDACAEIQDEKSTVFARYAQVISSGSSEVLARGMALLRLKAPGDPAVAAALRLYINALLNRYLIQYRECPDLFFQMADTIKAELKRDIDFMLYGVCREDLK